MALSPFRIITANINAGSATAQLIGTTTGKFVVTGIRERIVTVSGLTVLNTRSIGTNSSTYNNLIASGILATLTNVDDIITDTQIAGAGVVAAGTAIYYNNTVAATTTTLTIQVEITGYYI